MPQDTSPAFGDAITAPRYRTVREARIIDFLISPYAIAEGRRPADEAAARTVLQRCMSLGLPFRTEHGGERLFDPVEVVNGIKQLHFSRGEPIWMERSVGMLRRLMAEAVPGTEPEAPPDLSRLGAELYRVTIRRCYGPTDHGRGAKLRLRLPLPLEGLKNVHVLPLAGHDIEYRILRGRIEAQLTAFQAGEIEIGAMMEFNADPTALSREPPPDEAARRLWTRTREGLIHVDSNIRELALQITKGHEEPWQMMQGLWDYLFDGFRLGFIHYDHLNPEDPLGETLRTKRFDCLTGSALLVSLCRALGLPARLVSGYTLNPVLPTAHHWCEAWLPGSGWAAFDLYAFDLAGGDRNSPWRQHFFGRLDHRLVSERLPLEFCGTGNVRLPAAWQLVGCRRDDGAENSYETLDTGDLVYRETVDVIRGDQRPDHCAP